MGVWQDVRFAVRLLLKHRWFTAVAVLALALGIGVNTTAFTIVNTIMLRGLPFDRPDRIVGFTSTDARGRQLATSKLAFLDIQESSQSYQSLGGASRRRRARAYAQSRDRVHLPEFQPDWRPVGARGRRVPVDLSWSERRHVYLFDGRLVSSPETASSHL